MNNHHIGSHQESQNIRMNKTTKSSQVTVKRANQSIGIKPVSGKMTLISRKLFHLLIYFIQEDGVKDVYRRSLRSFVNGIDYRSNDTTIIKEALRSLMRTEIEWNSTLHSSRSPDSNRDDDGWISETTSNLVAEITVIEKGKGSEVYVEWSFPPKLRERLLDPKRFTKFSYYFEIKSHAVLALFEIAERYRSNPTPKTCKEPWEWWLAVLTGSTQEMEYKYFKRDVVMRALKELNAIVSEYSLELEEHRDDGGRKVTALQFIIHHTTKELSSEPELEKIPSPINTELVNQIINLGIKEADAVKYYNQHSEDFLKRTIALVIQRNNNKGLPALSSVAAYFSHAIKGKYADAVQLVAPPPPTPEPGAPRPTTLVDYQHTAIEKYKVMIQSKAEAYFNTLESPQKQSYVDSFLESNNNDTIHSSYKKSQFKSSIFKKAFYLWFGLHLWGEPSDEEIAEFIASPSNAIEAKIE